MCLVAEFIVVVRAVSARLAASGYGVLLASLLMARPLCAAAQAASQPAGNETATIHGAVLSTVDKKPIPRALVTLMDSHRSALTDDKGQFAFSGVPFGTEDVSVQKPEFLCPAMRSPQAPHCFQNVVVVSNDVAVNLAMMPQAVVTGRIVDQTGEPGAKLHLFLMQRTVDNGLFVWNVLGQTSANTDSEGNFRIANLEPGFYLLKTASMADSEVGRTDRDHGYAGTYYPGTPDQSAARPLVVHAGEEFKADLVVMHERFQPVELSFALNGQGRQGGIGWGFAGKLREEYLQSDFESSHDVIHLFAPAGDYKVVFTVNLPTDPKTGSPEPWPDGTKLPYSGSVEFTVKDQPVTVTAIPSQQPITFPLHVRAMLTEQEKRKAAVQADGVYEPPSASFTLSAQLLEFDANSHWRADKDLGDFEFEKIPPGRYAVKASMYRDTYISSLTCGSINLLREPLIVGPGVPVCSIEAVVRDDLASLTVGLTPKAMAQLTAAGISVTDLALIPIENSMELPYSTFVWRGAEPRAARISPGTYLAFLFDGRAIAWRDPNVRNQLMRLGTLITIAPGQSKTVLLDWSTELNAGEPIGVGLGRVLP